MELPFLRFDHGETIAMLRDMVKMGMPGKFPVEPERIHPVIDALIAARAGTA